MSEKSKTGKHTGLYLELIAPMVKRKKIKYASIFWSDGEDQGVLDVGDVNVSEVIGLTEFYRQAQFDRARRQEVNKALKGKRK